MGSYIKRCYICRTNLVIGTDQIREFEIVRGAYYCKEHAPTGTFRATKIEVPEKIELEKRVTDTPVPVLPDDTAPVTNENTSMNPLHTFKMGVKNSYFREGSGVTRNRYESDHTFMTDLEKKGSINVSHTIDIFLACAEAEYQVNTWLDTLNNPEVSDERKAEVRELLKAGAPDYQWLLIRRQDAFETLSRTK